MSGTFTLLLQVWSSLVKTIRPRIRNDSLLNICRMYFYRYHCHLSIIMEWVLSEEQGLLLRIFSLKTKDFLLMTYKEKDLSALIRLVLVLCDSVLYSNITSAYMFQNMKHYFTHSLRCRIICFKTNASIL